MVYQITSVTRTMSGRQQLANFPFYETGIIIIGSVLEQDNSITTPEKI
jgi:hypothetical protein